MKKISFKFLVLTLLLPTAFVLAGRGNPEAAPVLNHKKYIAVKTPLNSREIRSIEVIVSLPRVKNRYGHTALRLKFYDGNTLEAGFIVADFESVQSGKSKGKKPVYLEIYSDTSYQSMYRQRQFKLEYAPLLLSQSEKENLIRNINEIALYGTRENYKMYTNNCATMAMKLIKRSLVGRSCDITSNPAKVVSSLADDALVDVLVADRVDEQFSYYKAHPYNP